MNDVRKFTVVLIMNTPRHTSSLNFRGEKPFKFIEYLEKTWKPWPKLIRFQAAPKALRYCQWLFTETSQKIFFRGLRWWKL